MCPRCLVPPGVVVVRAAVGADGNPPVLRELVIAALVSLLGIGVGTGVGIGVGTGVVTRGAKFSDAKRREEKRREEKRREEKRREEKRREEKRRRPPVRKTRREREVEGAHDVAVVRRQWRWQWRRQWCRQ